MNFHLRYMLTANNTLIIRGQASIELLEGEVSVLGAPLLRKHKLLVRQEKQLPLEAETVADLEILLAKSGEFFEIEGSTIPASWSVAAEALAEMEQGKVMVIGATDVGKSTFCTYLANRMLKDGLRVRVVDADIGQADIGPPTTIGSSVPKSFLSSLIDLEPDALIFIGHTSPKQVEIKLTQGIQRLISRGDHDSLTVINTDGWVLDPEAISYKINMINAIKPDLVVGLAAHSELQPLLSASHAHSLRINTAEEILKRSRSDRRQIRVASYRRYLEGGKAQTIPLNGVSVLAPREFPSIQASTNRELKGLVVGLLDDNGYMLQLGIFMSLESEGMRVYSRSVEGVRKMDFGYVKLSTDGTELKYLEPRTHR
jgi:polynucleotide 5'-hydroxyl-kinase GRC3/NOL9